MTGGPIVENISTFEYLGNKWYGGSFIAQPGHCDESEIDSCLNGE
jgi:hypothetical protein